MAKTITVFNLIFLILLCATAFAQDAGDTTGNPLKIPTKYITGIDKKITQYTSRITGKTEKTLSKLSRWENKIKGLLQKINPEAAARLFGINQLTFTSLLQQFKNGEAMALQYQAPYDKYRDDITTTLKYITQQKEQSDSGLAKIAAATRNRMDELSVAEDKSEAIQQFIRERKKQLGEQAFQYFGNSRYFTRINKEAYYYTETLKNYKEIFSNEKKAEETVKALLNKIPAFQRFMKKNSQLAALFGQPDDLAGTANIAGLQTRLSVQALMQERVAVGGPNAMQQLQENIQEAKSQLSRLKEKMLKNPGGENEEDGLSHFKPNNQKTKTFLQRMEYSYNLQFVKNNNLLPATSDIGLSAGYKINDKSVIGAGAVYKLGIGSIRHIRFTNEGIGLRTFIDWKLKKQFFMSGGYEINHNAQFKNFELLKNYDAWQRSALLGITKKVNLKTKLFKGTNLQLLYDFLSQRHVPVSQPVLFRAGYNF